MLQIFILAAVAIFLFWRLYFVLGTRTGFEKNERERKTTQPDIRENTPKKEFNEQSQDEDISDYIELKSKSGIALKKVKNKEPHFTVNSFVAGAKNAYELILMAFEKGDLKILEENLSEEVFKDFERAVVDRADKGLVIESEFVGMREIRIKNVLFREKSNEAEITVSFKCELTSIVRDKENNVVEGNNRKIKKQSDIWTFGRVIGSDDPSWKLIATGQ
jgi:predicted lipid-binding transport protein (Tim44 family)